MFHRVKSEVQDSEQKQQEVSSPYRREESRDLSTDHKDEQKPQQVDEAPARSYGNIQPKQQEEPSNMRTQEKAPVQGKYARAEQEDNAAETAYSPSLGRTGAYQAGGSSYAPATTPTYAPRQEATAYSGGDRVLTIGRGINMSGEIESCDHLLVEGTVEAALKGAKMLDIAESGVFYGTVEIEEATIAGRFEGDITVNGRLTLKSTGIITGSIAYRELEVESGAVLDGRMTPLKGVVDPKSVDKYRAGTEASAMAKAKDVSSKKDDREPANTETGLFSRARNEY